MRIIYMGTPDFAVTALEAIYRKGHEILCAVSQPDKPTGRHAELTPTPVKKKALELGIPVLQPDKASRPDFIQAVRSMEPDVIVVAAYGKILKKELLDIPKYGCINIHGSLLPRWRGAAPIQWAVVSGDRETGLTVMQMAEGMDTGDILLQKAVPIAADETGGSLFEKLSVLSGPMITEALDLLEKGMLKPEKQSDESVTYAPVLKKEMGELDTGRPAEELERRIRGLYPWPGCFLYLNGKTLKIHKAQTADIPAGILQEIRPGKLFSYQKQLFLKCGGSVLLLQEVQPEGKKRMSGSDFLLGNKSLLEQ